MIRIAQLGWDMHTGALATSEVNAGIGCYWIEINGVRIERVVRAEVIAADDEITVPRLVLDVSDGVQIVYVDRDGNPLPDVPPVDTTPENLAESGPMEHRSVTYRENL